MLAFVTVGSTSFDALVQRVLSEPVLHILRLKGYSTVVVQYGTSDLNSISETHWPLVKYGVHIEVWPFKTSLQSTYEEADLVISHAGSGTILDVLRLGKPLIVVPNPTLLDNHQEEIASSLSALGHLKASTVFELSNTIEHFDTSTIIPFPPFDGSKFRDMLDEEVGFL
jgi:beta-1,4-N-acetylglucosaminyltransferase